MAAQTTTTSPDQQKRKSMTRPEYLAFLADARRIQGGAWYDLKIKQMEEADARRNQQRDASNELWMQKIDQWSAAGGFEMTEQELCGQWPVKRVAAARFQYSTAIGKFEVNRVNRTCSRFDGQSFANGKRGKREALGLAMAVMEINGSANAFRDAKNAIINISGIEVENGQVSEADLKKLEEMKAKQAEEAARRAELEAQESPISDEDEACAPVPITDPVTVDNLTRIMARERSFPIEFARRVVAKGTIAFGEFQYRGRDGAVVNTRRPIAVSRVYGIDSGFLVGYASREFKEFYKSQEGKGKNLGAITKGIVHVTPWKPTSTRLIVAEGVYTALALLHLRETRGRPLGDHEALVVTAGSRDVTRLLKIAKERGITEVVSAFDSDPSGFDKQAKVQEWCAANAMKHTSGLPPRGEVEISLRDDDWGRAALLSLARELAAAEKKYLFGQPDDAGRLTLFAESCPASARLVTDMKRSAQAEEIRRFGLWLAGKKVDPAKINPEQKARFLEEFRSPELNHKPMTEHWHRKDWNDLIQKNHLTKAETPFGLPDLEPALNGWMHERLVNMGISKALIQRVTEARRPYPAMINGRKMLVWAMLEKGNDLAVGYRAEGEDGLGPDGKPPQIAGAAWRALLAVEPEKPSAVVLAHTTADFLRAWDLTKDDVAVFLENKGFPNLAADYARRHKVPVAPFVSADENKEEIVAQYESIAREKGLASTTLEEHLVPRPPVAPDVDGY